MRILWVLAIGVLRLAAQSSANCDIRGEVRDSVSGAPVAKATILLEAVAGSDRYIASSEGAGKFCFKNVSPGGYFASVEKMGYLHDKESAEVQVVAPQAADVSLAATPAAEISGRVVDADGEPVPDAGVSVLIQVWRQGRHVRTSVDGGEANERGEFRIGNLESG